MDGSICEYTINTRQEQDSVNHLTQPATCTQQLTALPCSSSSLPCTRGDDCLLARPHEPASAFRVDH